MKKYYQLQASETEQGMELRSAEIKEKARWCTPGLPMDLIQQMVKEEPDVTKQDIGQITEVQRQAILWKCKKAPRTTRPGTEKGYYVYIEDEGGMYLETIDEKGVPMLVLDTETDRQLPTDHITEQDTDKYFMSPDEQEDGNNTETISSISTADYDREEVEASLATVAEAFHTIGSKYERLCTIVPQMTKVQAASVISRLPVIPFLGKKEKVKVETKPRDGYHGTHIRSTTSARNVTSIRNVTHIRSAMSTRSTMSAKNVMSIRSATSAKSATSARDAMSVRARKGVYKDS